MTVSNLVGQVELGGGGGGMFAADPLVCRDKGRWFSTTKVAEMAAPPGTFFNSIPSLRIYRNNYVCNTSIHFLDVIQLTYQSILKR